VYYLGHPPPSKQRPGVDGRPPPLPPTRIFASWIKSLPSPLPPKTTARVFRLLFPHEGNRRRYGLRETKLAAELEPLLAIEGLMHWDAVSSDGAGGLGCLGDVVAHAVLERVSRCASHPTI
jgi:DNA ligase-4